MNNGARQTPRPAAFWTLPIGYMLFMYSSRAFFSASLKLVP